MAAMRDILARHKTLGQDRAQVLRQVSMTWLCWSCGNM